MKARSLKESKIPLLSGWMTVPEVAAIFGCSPNRINQLIKGGLFAGVIRRVGAAALVIPNDAVHKAAKMREEEKAKAVLEAQEATEAKKVA